MSIIYSYPEQSTLNAGDMLIGTSVEKVGGKQKNVTKNFTVQQIADFINQGTGFVDPVASDFQIPVFNQEGKKITGSIMSQDVFPNGSTITIAGSLTATSNISTVGNLSANGVVTLGSQNNLISLNSLTKLGGPIQDATGTLGNVNQILLSNGSGNVVWQNYEAGLTYEGTWDAANNTTNGLSNSPALLQGVGVSGHFYIVNVEGTTSLGPGLNDWHVGDWAIFLDEGGQPASWQKIDNTSTLVGSGTTGTLSKWTNATTLNDSLVSEAGTVVSVNGELKVKDTIQATTGPSTNLKLKGVGTGGIEIMSADGITDGKIQLNCSVNSHGVTLQSPAHPYTSYTLILPTSFGGAGDVLTSAGANPSQLVWTTPTTGTVTGTGTENYVTKWSAGGTGIQNSTIFDNGTNVGIGTTSPTNGKLVINSTGYQTSFETGTAGDGRLNIGHFSNGTFIGTYGDDGGAADIIRFGTHSGDERMRITSAGNVGIGTSSPAAKLDVDGGTDNLVAVFSSTDDVAQIQIVDNDTSTFLGSKDGLSYISQTAGTPSDGLVVDSSGNVGIGTSSPSAKLEVAGSIKAGVGGTTATDAVLTLNSGNASGGEAYISLQRDGVSGFLLNHSSSAIQVRGTSDLPMYFYTNNSIKQTILSNGNVGIGTTSPGAKLEVAGDISLAGSVIHVGDTNTEFGFHGNDLFRVVTGGTERFEVSNSGIIINDGGSDYNFRVESDNNQNMLFVDGGADKVGIGTASPAVSLDISATDAVQMPVGITTDRPVTGVSNGMLRYNSTNNEFEGYINGNWGSIGGGASGGLIFQGTFDASTGAITGGGSLYTCPAGGTGGTVDIAVGDLYIVTTAGSFYCSGTNLNVGDEVICITAATAGNSNASYWNAVASGAGGAVTGSGTTNYVPKFTGATVVGNSSIFNDASGNVGIGTNSPGGYYAGANNLVINNASGAGLTIASNNTSDGSVYFADGITGAQAYAGYLEYNHLSDFFRIGVNAVERMRIDSSGNVGIGTGSSIDTNLHIQDTGSTYVKIERTTSGSEGVLSIGAATNFSSIFSRDGSTGGKDLMFETAGSGTESMRIDSSGNVGIGTDSPSNKLQVSGSANNDDIAIRISNTFDNNDPASEPNAALWLNAASNNGYLRVHGAPANTASKHQIDLGSTAGTSFLTFSPNSAERMRIASNGNVGIGTTSPGAKLEVKNGSTGQVYSNVEGILIDTNGNSNSYYSLRIGSSAGNDNLVVTNAGNVGIGTDSPGVSLDLGNNTDAIRVPNGTTANRPSGTLPGMIRYNTSTNEFEGYSGTLNVSGSWGALGGGLPTKTVNTFTGSGQSFIDLTVEASSVNYIDMYIDGVYQAKATYTIATPGGTGISRLTLVSGTFPTGVSIETVTTT